MATRRPPWFVPQLPINTEYGFFISHVQNDAQEVKRLKKVLEGKATQSNQQLKCFLDLDDWPLGSVNLEVIRKYLLRSQFMIAWITPGYLANTRGWIWVELACATLIELSLNGDRLDTLSPFIVPIFRGVRVDEVARTPWLEFWQRNLGRPTSNTSIPKLADLLLKFRHDEIKRRLRPET